MKRLENFKDKNEELLNAFSTTNKTNKTPNIQSKKLVYDGKHSFAMLKNIDNIKKLSLDSMFNTMRMYHKKFTSLNSLTPRTKNKEKLKLKVLMNAGDIYNKLYYIYKNRYNKMINSLDTKNRTKFDY